MTKIKAITAQLNAEGKTLLAIPSTSVKIQSTVLYLMVFPLLPTQLSIEQSIRGVIPEATKSTHAPLVYIPGIGAPCIAQCT